MDSNKQVQILQIAYAGVLADAVLQFSKENILAGVIERKHHEQFSSGKLRAAQFGITKPEEVFFKLAEIFGCAQWEIVNNTEDGFVAQSSSCRLCAIAKKMGAPSPCHLYCLDPMEGIIKAVQSDETYVVEETQWESKQCRVRVGRSGK